MPALSDDRLVAERQSRHEVVESGRLCCTSHVRRRGGRTAVANVLQNYRVERDGFLVDQQQPATQIVESQRPQIDAVEEYETAVRIGETQEQVGDGRFPAAAGTNDRDTLARLHPE